MNDISLVEKTEILMNIIVSSPLFLFCFMFGIALLIYYVIEIKKEKKVNKWFFIFMWSILGLILIIKYNSIVLFLVDSLFDSLFMALYFPNLLVYIVVLIISNFFLFYSLINKKVKVKNKILNFVSSLIINLFLILIIDIVKTNNINIYNELDVYTNAYLLTLLQLTTAIFTSWILLSLLFSAYDKLKKYDKQQNLKSPQLIFEDI